jgi:cytochrome c oxidase subunit 2
MQKKEVNNNMLPIDISEHGYLVDRVIKISVGGTVIIGVVSFAILFYILWRFRRSKNPTPLQDVPPLLKKVVYIDFVMIVFDLILLFVSTYAWFIFFIRPVDKIKKEVVDKGEKFVEVKVIGRQFFWTFQYPGKDGKFGTSDDFNLGNVLVVPENHYVFVKLTSGDTLHSLFIPNVRIKYDAIPGRETHLWFKPAKTGVYEIACAELCGEMHYRMKAYLVVLSEKDYKKWIEEAPYEVSVLKDFEEKFAKK